jgi:peptide/nickel transport system substrate-binding protein
MGDSRIVMPNRRSSMTRRQWLKFSTLGATGVLLAANCQSAPTVGPGATASAGASGVAKSGGHLKYALLRDPANFEPHLYGGYTSLAVQGSLYDLLVEYDEKAEIRGALAERWEHPDALTYIFHLRKGVQFHNGKPFDASDVVATLGRIKNPATSAEQRITVENIAKIETPDAYTVRLTLATPQTVFLTKLARPTMYMLSKDDIASGFTFRTKANGTGPFMLDSFEQGTKYVFKKNPNYWRKGFPYLDQITMLTVPDDQARVNALKTGEVDFADSIPWQEYKPLETAGFNVYRSLTTFTFIRLNSSVAPFDNKKVRQALNYIVDREEVLQTAFGGNGRIVDGALELEGTPFYSADLKGFYKKDWDKAKALLAEAGYKSPAEVPPLTWSVVNLVTQSAPSQVILQQFQQFGLRVTYKTIDTATLLANRSSGAYQLMTDAMGFANNDPDGFREYFDSRAGTSYATGTKYKNDEVDRLLAQGATMPDGDARKQLYRQAEGIIVEDAPWVFLNYRPSAEGAAKYVKGYVVPPGVLGVEDLHRWQFIWLDK